MIAELRAQPRVTVRRADLGPATPAAELAAWQAKAGPAWPDGMTELYSELSSVDIEWQLQGDCGGEIHLPPIGEVWDYDRLEDQLWFDFLPAGHPFHSIRPIDRFVPEACAVLYPVPSDREAQVHFHYCGESLVPTGLGYRQWLELLFRSRGAFYWLTLTLGPPGARTWVEECIDEVASLFPDFAPSSMQPTVPFEELEI
ncbi:MAG TPA: hypothetical protein VL326_08925 [Kofleriaceae bacterium]|nr:hypothetical protein [Kofleriaceae bacterium]